MTNDDLQSKVQDLRRQLNGGNYRTNGPIESGSTGGDTLSDNSSVDSSQRRTRQDVRTTDSRTTRGKTSNSTGTRKSDGVKRVTKTVLTGVRPSTDGHEQDNSSSDTTRRDDEGTVTRGRLIRDESEPPNRSETNKPTEIFIPVKRQPGRPKKSPEVETDRTPIVSPIQRPRRATEEESVSKRFNWFNQTNTITEQEADRLLKPLAHALVDYGGYIDDYAKVKLNNQSVVFFSDLSYEEGTVLAKVLLRFGKQNAQMATGIRTLAEGNDYISAVMILWPRIAKLVAAMRPEGATFSPIRQSRERKPGLFYRPPINEKAKE